MRSLTTLRDWLSGLCRPPYSEAESIRRWAADYGIPATEAEYLDALASGMIPPPEA